MTQPAHPVTGLNATESLHAALALVRPRAASLTDDDLAMLRERLCIGVDQMRAEGIPLKQAVIIVKDLAAVAGLQWVSIELVDQLASWCAERYGSDQISGRSDVDPPTRLSQFE